VDAGERRGRMSERAGEPPAPNAAPASLVERLRRLRREPAARDEVAHAALAGVLRERARRAARGRRTAAPIGAESAAAERTVGPPGELREAQGPAGVHAARVRLRPREHRHGDWALGEVRAASGDALALLGKDARLAAIDPEAAVYLDIETTGLSGGAGTIPFLVALGRFTDEGFELWQGFLRGPEEERALLAEAAERIAAASAVVSFFGKSFDRHRLEDKMRVHGVASPFGRLPHLDLYHPLARLYRDQLDDGRLASHERALCGVRRGADLAGSHAPEAWFDWLAGRAHRLEGVFRHNEDDVLSLVVLAAHLGRVAAGKRADGSPLAGPPAARCAALARLHADAGRRAEALAWAERARAEGPLGPRLAGLRAELLRREGRLEEAWEAHEELAAGADVGAAVGSLSALARLALGRLRGIHGARAPALVDALRARVERGLVGRARARGLAEHARLARRLAWHASGIGPAPAGEPAAGSLGPSDS